MPALQRTLADLNCRLVGPGEKEPPPAACVILCHGYGAGGGDLVPLADEFVRLGPDLEDRVLFVFPEAPLPVADVPGGRAWWPIDLDALQQAGARGELRQLRQEIPPGLPEARQKLMSLIQVLQQQTGLPVSKFVLGGFSQGSMLATDVALRLEEAIGGLLIYSGTLLVEPEWTQLAPGRRGLRVLQSHGTIDPLLPYEAALWLRDLLNSAGADIEFLSFPGMHTIPVEALPPSVRIITDVLAAGDADDQG